MLSVALIVPSVGAAETPHDGAVTVYPAPKGAPVSRDYAVTVGEKPVDVYAVGSARFATCDIAGPVAVSITANFIVPGAVHSLSLHPLSMRLPAKREGNTLTFRVEKPRSITVLLEAPLKPERAWRRHAVNLSAYAGKKVMLRFVLDPGVDTKHDWFQWGAPKVVRVTGEGEQALLDTGTLTERSERGLVGWPYGESVPVGHGAVVRPRVTEDRKTWCVVGGERMPGVILHPAWKDGHREPIYVQWAVDLSGSPPGSP
jgi:hypothetical protein